MALYYIISVEPYGKILNADKTILVKANRVEEKYENDLFLGYSFSEFESDLTDWFIFRDSEWNMKNIMYVTKQCGKGKFWDADTSNQQEINYLDGNNMVMTKEAFICDCDYDYGYGKPVLCSYLHGEPIEPYVPPVPPVSTENPNNSNKLKDNSFSFEIVKPNWFLVEKYNHFNGFHLLKKLLSISNDEGRLVIDSDTFLPISDKDPLLAKAVRALMVAYNIKPKEFDYDGLDAHKDYMFCFINDTFSEERQEKTVKLLYRFIGKNNEIKDMANESLSSRKSRYRLFSYYFYYLKKLVNIEDVFTKKIQGYNNEFFLSKVITDIVYSKNIVPLVKYYSEILVLLMGDYADIEWEKDILIREYGYPGVPNRDDSTETDLPF